MTDTATIAPVVETQAAPVVDAPIVDAAPVVTESAPIVVEQSPAPIASTVLGDAFKNAAEEKPAEAADTAPSEITEGQSDEPAPPPSYEQWSIPEGVTLDESQLGEFTNMLGEFESLSKADHAEVQKFGQNLVNYHITEMQKLAESLTQNYAELQRVNLQRALEADLDALRKDPSLGGSGDPKDWQSVQDANRAIRMYGGTPEQQAELGKIMVDAGVANKPALVRLFANIGKATHEGRPLPARAPSTPQAVSKLQKFYGSAK